ncbi:MAG: response regulator transcription factor [Candidatus Izemoplasmataceae bacterium]
MIKLLLVEDNLIVANTIAESLKRQGYSVDLAIDAETAEYKISQKSFDLILLDLMLPSMDGGAFLKKVRQSHDIPVIIVSSKDTEIDKAMHLEYGADDYVTKPVAVIELVARIKAVLRRSENNQKRESVYRFNDLMLDEFSHEVVKNNQVIKLTVIEYNLLKLFLSHPSKVFSKEALYENVWDDNYYGTGNTINVHIRRLREKIEDDPSNPKVIETVWGIGYKLGKENINN